MAPHIMVVDKTRHTRQGAVERVILELIDADRKRSRRHSSLRTPSLTVGVGWGDSGYALERLGKRELFRDADGVRRFTRSGAIATRAAMRRFVAKHPAFAIESTEGGGLYLYDVKSRERELADQAETAAWLAQAFGK